LRVLAVCVLLLVFQLSVLEATPLHPAFDLQGEGLTMAVAGVGLAGGRGTPRTLTINIAGPVELAVLYWTGRDRPCPEDPPGSGVCVIPSTPYKDQVLTLDGEPLVGTLIGSEEQPDANPGAINNLGYMADVTDRVRAKGPGHRIFHLGDGEPGNDLADLDGAGLLVVSTAPGAPAARVIVFHGLDFAYGEDRTHGPTEITQPIAINHGGSRFERHGELALFAGDALATAPDRIDISGNPSLLNRLDSSAGAQWDADVFPVDLPAGSLSTTVQLVSEPYGRNPDSLLWVMAALRVPLPVLNGCDGVFWAGHVAAWIPTGIHTSQTLGNTFVESKGYAALGGSTILGALRLRDGPGLVGAAKALLRAASAALLNASHPTLEYPHTRTQVITEVDTALRQRDPAAILDLARQMDEWNGAACPLH
jgi:hypothetical protein